MNGTRRWIGYVALTVVFALACGLLSWWQWSRRAEAVEAIELVEQNFDAAPVPLEAELPVLDDWSPSQEWQPVVMTGTYLVEDQLLVRNRPRNGGPGWEVLTPLRLDDGRVFVVDRGWLPLGSVDDVPDVVPAPPEGVVTVVARLKAGEPTLPGRSAPEGQISTIHLPQVADLVAGETWTGAYGLLESEDPAADSRPLPVVRPPADEGPHLSYAFQWIAFGVLAFVALFWGIRHERRARLEEERVAAGGEPAPERRRGRGGEDADAEDALLDAAGR
ncbi:SURF1 family cytochrome oxidase biogenesis protein [Homoserinibacter sp. YIM 151385]|uniref:SURF1 family cytochrome oxidase biogenesis protein n=1 Tax=Homoserinibacter sp. YIM 151385 TaxID=2985506 RepID=UPI0022F055F3|nr:SURF1 family protein [Homoserinibacter sp. YIM 151385]WBU38587.1 SURF1 family protein [Homoserinibacter sp. YIM 151385]